MDYQNVVRDFAQRTRRNLEFVRRAAEQQSDAGDPQVFEVTQLINSMLGLLVFPKEHYFKVIPETPLSQLTEEGWPEIPSTGQFPPASDLRQLFCYLRNAIAHFNIEFLAPSGQLEGVRLWNVKNGKQTWDAELSLTQLQEITDRFIVGLDEWTQVQPRNSAE